MLQHKWVDPQIKINTENVPQLGHIKPLVYVKDELFHIVLPDLDNVSFIWDPEVTEKAENYRLLGRTNFIVSCGYYGLFKPSISEVLAGIPGDISTGVDAFAIDPTYMVEISTCGGFQRGLVELYQEI